MMPFTREQVIAILAHAFPGVPARDAQVLGKRSILLTLSDQRRVVLRGPAATDDWAGDPLAAEARALQVLRGEIDLPLPQLLSYAPKGEPMGKPYLLLSYLEGEPLPQIIAQLNEEQRYAIGRDLGALMTRVHAHTAPTYGVLPAEGWSLATSMPEPTRPANQGRRSAKNQRSASVPSRPLAPTSSDDVDYLAERLHQALDAALAAGELDTSASEQILAWLHQTLAPSNQRACLLHGDLRPERVLLRRRASSWQIAGLLGWSYALAWRPAWDHVTLQEAGNSSDYFSLRVGYGNAYDAAVERAYDQLRELALQPYRMVLYLEAGRADLALGLLADRVRHS